MRYYEIIVESDLSANENFTRWFGNSKVVDSSGKPLKVYHGTNKTFDEFKKAKKYSGPFNNAMSRDKHIGIFFTDNVEAAHFYCQLEDNETIIPVYLSLQNPLIVDLAGAQKSPDQMLKFWAEAKANKNDGIIVQSETLYIVFKATQIKSAIGNIGSFNPKSKKLSD